MQSRAVKVVEGGKLVIPASYRREIGIDIGDTVVVELLDGELRIRSRKVALRRIQDRVRRLGTKDRAAPNQSEAASQDDGTQEVANG